MQIDGASGGFVNPFLYPDYKWDFRLPRVQSINASGHKRSASKRAGDHLLGGGATLLPDKTVTFNGTHAANVPVTCVKFDFGFTPDPSSYVELVVP